MITVGTYVKLILRKRKMTQAQLIRKMKQMNLGSVDECHLNNFINGTSGKSYVWARRIELALELPDYSLIKMMGMPSEFEWKKIKEVEKNVSN